MKNDAYVYKHISVVDTNEVFYVGMSTNNKDGKHNRQYSKSRSKRWKEYIKNNDYKVEIVKEDLSMGEAVDLESQLIQQYKLGGNLTNVRGIEDYEQDYYYVFSSGIIYLRSLVGAKISNVITALCAFSEYNKNTVTLDKITREKIKSTALIKTDSQFCKCLKTLEETGGIKREDDLITINYKYFWKGDLEKHKRMLNKQMS